MARFFIKELSLLALIIACVQAQPLEEIKPVPSNVGKLIALAPQGRSVYDQYTLGSQVDGAKIIYSYQHTQSFDSTQDDITLTFDYPSADEQANNNPYIITQVVVYLEAADGATTQAYVSKEGIGERSISLELVAHNSNSLHYMVVIYGKEN